VFEAARVTEFGGDLACFASARKSFHTEVREIATLEATERIRLR